jgi:hypothetical protein
MATNDQPSLVDYYRTRAVRTLPDPSTSAWDWQLHGSCREMDSAIFFPVHDLDGLETKHMQKRCAVHARWSLNAVTTPSMPLNHTAFGAV